MTKDAGMTALEDFLRETIGLESDSLGRGAVARAAKKQMLAHRCEDLDAYVRLLRRDPALKQQLIEELVVPETWFFRDRQPFDLLARLAKERPRPVRVLSMPCSTGEEAYSMAMTLLDAGFSPEEIRIDAVDISERSLEIARRGDYGSNAFRGDERRARDDWFHAHGHGRWQIDTKVKACVAFHQGNIFEFTAAHRYDFIFCRNLLIYFDPPKQAAAVNHLMELLAKDGVFFVGHAEAAVALRQNLSSLAEARSFAFSRQKEKTAVKPVREPARPSLAVKPVAPVPVSKPASASAPSSKAPFSDVQWKVATPAKAVANAVSPLERIRELAGRGKLTDALKLAQSHLDEHGPSAEAFCLLGVVRDANGDASGAESAYRKALYLDPHHDESITHLALLLEKRGDPGAERLWQRVRKSAAKGGGA